MCEGIESLVNICTKCNCPIIYEKKENSEKHGSQLNHWAFQSEQFSL